MKIISILIFIVLSLSAQEWFNDFENGIATAQKENKGVFLVLKTPNCHFCTQFENETLSDPAVKDALKDYILISLLNGRDYMPRNLRVSAFPSFLLINQNGDPIFEHRGTMSPSDFLDSINSHDTDWDTN